MNQTNYPLSWPAGWKRKATFSKARFQQGRQRLTVPAAMKRLEAELERLLGYSERSVISTNLEPTLRGVPRSGQAEPADPGVAVYFNFRKQRTVLACDKWNRTADNIASIAAHIACMRGIERYAVGTLEQAFRGYQALEDFSSGIPWRRVLGFKDGEAVTRDVAESRFRDYAKRVHPDLSGADGLQMSQLNSAIGAARKELTA